MPVPADHGFPVKRPGIITEVYWEGEDDDLALVVRFEGELGQSHQLSFQTRNVDENHLGEICLPSGVSIEDADEDAIVASIRMGAFISGAIAGSGEFLNMFSDQEGSSDIQVAIGNVKVVAVRVVSDVMVEIDVKRKNTSLVRTIVTSHSAVSNYRFTPDTQLKVIAGAIEKAHPGHVHDYPDDKLTQSQKDDIVATVMALEPWI